ncbi:MAG TPA: exonuclease SbcCD subunit D [Aeromicrobium sp.]|nr:exonuclease SbcCD subunit D [Aeromicrobium sp.]
MRILHTSDWHLGRTLHGTDMHEHQQAFLDHLVGLVAQRKIDAVLVAGDVYDRAIPSVETVRLLSDALSRLSDITTVILTPGNHDSAVRIGFAAGLLRDNVRILASVDDLDKPVVLSDEYGEVVIYGFPYLDPDGARASLAAEDGELPARSHAGVLTAAMDRVRSDLARRAGSGKVRSIVMAHAFVTGGAQSDSERDITIGGVDSAPSAIFDGVDYVALGHLHGPQRITIADSSTRVRYSGSPLAYSFSEMLHKKSSVVLEFGANGLESEELVLAPVPRPLAELRGPIDEILGPDSEGVKDAWLRILVTDPTYPTDMVARLRQRFPYALVMQHVSEGSDVASLAQTVTEEMNPMEVAADFIDFVTNAAPTDSESRVLLKAYEAVKAEQLSQ